MASGLPLWRWIVQKNNVPHLYKFAWCSRALLTVRGRPPFCLRCYKVGQVRNVCDGYDTRPYYYHDITRSVVEVVVSGNHAQSLEDTTEMDKEVRQIIKRPKKSEEGCQPRQNRSQGTRRRGCQPSKIPWGTVKVSL